MAGPRRPGWFDRASIGRWPAFHINPQEIEDEIFLHGSGGELRRAMLCPCRRIESQAANAACGVCNGVGFVYPDEMREWMIFLDHSRKTSNRREAAGMLTDGQIAVTVPISGADAPPAQFDLLLPDKEVSTIHEHFHRDVRTVSNRTLADRQMYLAGPSPAVRPRPAKLLYPKVILVEAVSWILGVLGSGSERLVMARQGSDFQVIDGTIEWLTDRGPPEAAGFSVRYQASAAYEVFSSAPLFRREADAAMPWAVDAMRLDKIQRKADLR